MLVPFSIDSDALGVAPNAPGSNRTVHERLIDKWLAYGILVFEGQARNQSEVFTRINALPQALRLIWKAAFKSGRTMAGPIGWSGLHKMESTADLKPVAKTIQLACLETVRFCSALGLEETSDETCRTLQDTDIEVTRFDCADRAKSFQLAEALGKSGIPAGNSLAHVWSQRFAPLAAASQHVTLVDSYCLQDGDGINGLDRFISDLNRSSRGVSLAIYAASQIPRFDGSIETSNDLVSKVQVVSSRFPAGGLRSIEITLIPKRHFQRDSHGRYVRFDSNVIEVDLGAGLFFGDPAGNTWRRCQFSFKRADAFHQDAERDLRAHAEQGSPWHVR